MKYSLYLGKVSGIKISIHWTFLILIFWIVFSNLRSGLNFTEILWSVGFVLTIFLCVILHELGHALTAQRFNINTSDITILPIGGIARLAYIPEDPKQELIIALAGPAVNIVLAAILFPFVRFTTDMSELETFETIGAGNFLAALASVNLWLALFNLIPAFPMDGGRVLRALLAFRLSHVRATRTAASVGQVLAIIFVFLGFMYNPFLIFIGFFIFLGAQAESSYSQSRFLLKGYTVNDVLMHEIPVIDDQAPVKEAASKLLNSQNKNFVIMQAGKPVGTLSRDQIIQALATRGGSASIGEIKDKEMVLLTPDMPLEQAWQQLQQERKPLMLVMSDGTLSGVVDEENMAEFILIRSAGTKK